MSNREKNLETISAFMDGEESNIRLDVADHPDDLRAWATYHLISDLVKDSSMPVRHSTKFLEGVRTRIQNEPKPFVRRSFWLKRAAGAVAACLVIIAGYALMPTEEASLNSKIVSSTADASAEAVRRQQADYQHYLKAHSQLVGSDPSAFGG